MAYRKACVLCEFGAKVTVEAPLICSEIYEIPGIYISRKEFEDIDLEDFFLVVAATDNREKNHEISVLCREKNIPVNAVDQPEDCDFIFPSYVKEGDVVAAFCSGGNSPVLTQYLRDKNRDIVTGRIGRIADLLGQVREDVKRMTVSETERKKVYQELLAYLLSQEQLPDKEELQRIIQGIIQRIIRER